MDEISDLINQFKKIEKKVEEGNLSKVEQNKIRSELNTLIKSTQEIRSMLISK